MNDAHETTIIVTGAGTGIGRACAERLARPNVQLSLMGRRHEPIEAVAVDLRRKAKTAIPVTCDVRDPESVRSAIANTVKVLGSVDVLVNSAGIAGGGRTIDETDHHWNDVLQTNLSGTFFMCREILLNGGMLQNGSGRIVNIASTGGKQGVVFAAAYCASKHGVVGFTKSLGLELAKTGIVVNAVCPGFVETEMAENARQAYANLYSITVEQMRQRIETRVPIGRYIDPNEVAGLVEYLVFYAPPSVTAQAWNVCGGLGNY